MVSAAFSVTCARTHTHTIEAHTADNRRTLGSKIIITPWRSQRSLCIRREGMPLSNREITLSLSITKDLTEYRIFGITKHHNDKKRRKKWGWGWGGRILGSMWRMQNYTRTYPRYLIIIIIIIYPLTARVVGAPQMISQPVPSIFPCSPLPSGTWRTPGLSIPWCLPTSSSICLVFSPFHCALHDGFGQTWWTGDNTIPPSPRYLRLEKREPLILGSQRRDLNICLCAGVGEGEGRRHVLNKKTHHVRPSWSVKGTSSLLNTVQFSSGPCPIRSSRRHERRFSRDPVPAFSAGGPCEQFLHGQECPLFDVVYPAFKTHQYIIWHCPSSIQNSPTRDLSNR